MTAPDQGVAITERVPLAPLTTLGVGGCARWFARAGSMDGIAAADRFRRERSVPLFVLGGGSNIVVADEGFDGFVLLAGVKGVLWRRLAGETVVTAGAGDTWDDLVSGAVARGLAGLECLSGIPGSVGGTPIQNVGAYGQEVAGTIDRVAVYDLSDASARELTAAECGFSYRSSRFKTHDQGRFVVAHVTFRLRPGPPTLSYPDVADGLGVAGIREPSLADVRQTVLAIRRRKGMVLDAADPDARSVGSFFVNPVITEAHRDRIAALAGARPPGFAAPDGRVKIPAAWLVERAGFERGLADGAVAISSKHTLALVNRGGATARDVLRLASRIKRRVADRFDVWLRPEPVFVGFGRNDDLDVLQKANP